MFFLQKLQLLAEFCCHAKENEGLRIAPGLYKSTLKSLDLFVKLLSFVKIKVISSTLRGVLGSQIPTTLKTLETSKHASTPTPKEAQGKHGESHHSLHLIWMLLLACHFHNVTCWTMDAG